MKNYNNYINEGLLTTFFGNIFKSLMSLLDDDSKKIIDKSISDVEKSKNIKDTKNTLIDILNKEFNKINDLKDIKDLKNHLKENIIMINMFLKSIAKKYSIDKFQPNVLYKESKNALLKKTFVYDDDKDFQKNLEVNINSLLYEIAKKGGMSQDDVKKELNKEETTEANESKLYEADEPIETVDATEQKPDVKPADANAKEVENETNPSKSFEKIRKIYFGYHKDLLYNTLIKKFDEVIKNGGGKTIPNFDDFSKTFKATKNTDSVKTMINTLPTLDKNQLMKVRDAQGLNKKNTPL